MPQRTSHHLLATHNQRKNFSTNAHFPFSAVLQSFQEKYYPTWLRHLPQFICGSPHTWRAYVPSCVYVCVCDWVCALQAFCFINNSLRLFNWFMYAHDNGVGTKFSRTFRLSFIRKFLYFACYSAFSIVLYNFFFAFCGWRLEKTVAWFLSANLHATQKVLVCMDNFFYFSFLYP